MRLLQELFTMWFNYRYLWQQFQSLSHIPIQTKFFTATVGRQTRQKKEKRIKEESVREMLRAQLTPFQLFASCKQEISL